MMIQTNYSLENERWNLQCCNWRICWTEANNMFVFGRRQIEHKKVWNQQNFSLVLMTKYIFKTKDDGLALGY